MRIKIINHTGAEAEIIESESIGGIYYYTFRAVGKSGGTEGVIGVEFTVSSAKAFSAWNGKCGALRSLQPDWRPNISASKLTSGSPVQQITGLNGENIINISVLDVKSPIEIKTGIIEETAELICRVDFFGGAAAMQRDYETQIRIDMSGRRYEECLKDVRDWWRSVGGYIEPYVPECAGKPVYSTWYSFHQALSSGELIKQCRLSKELGMDMIIIDDGWQTEDTEKGYAYCGDWRPVRSKIPDMRSLADDIHALGMKVMLWFAVPFIGIHSEAFDNFKDKLINMRKEGFGCLDVRYKECRDYLIGIYKDAVTTWDIDGLKLDFIDLFVYPAADTPDPQRDTESIEDAVYMLLEEIYRELTQIKPELCFEFRQPYTGPAAAKFSNMLRVTDCPADPIKNRMGSADIRFLAGKTPVHSDMIMWDMCDSPENAAMQIINSMFCVQQISVLIDKLPEAHYRMLEYYLRVWRENSDTILNGSFRAENPECNYSVLSSELRGELFAVLYTNSLIEIKQPVSRIVLVNGTGGNRIYADLQNGAVYRCKVTDCMGNTVGSGTASSLAAIDVPKAGVVYLYIDNQS